MDDLFEGKKSVLGILVEKRIEEIAGSFSKISENEKEVKLWL